ncbi:MAG TPA: helix-turn-helix domain-containing protein [Blastocatellia bacterium]|nr:helix-turn-helix domain-containing protein [Blastocatellia bacterium]
MQLAVVFYSVYYSGMEKDFLTTTEAAARLGVSYRRVHQLIEAGTLKAERFGKVWLVPVNALDGVTTYGKAGRPPKAEGRPDTKKAAVSADAAFKKRSISSKKNMRGRRS